MSASAVAQNEVQERDPRRWMTLYTMIVVTLAIVFDAVIMSLIAPTVAADLNADPATINLATSVTVLMTAAFALGGGVLGDIYGRKRILTFGVIGLFITSLLAMIVPSAGLLIPVRTAAGIAAALVGPLALAIISVVFDAQERPKALGVYYATLGIIGGAGTIIIAILTQSFGWRSAFGLIIVLALASFVMTQRFVKESHGAGSKKVDWTGIALAAVGLFLLIYGINQMSQAGFLSSAVLLPVGIGIVFLSLLVVYSGRAANPALQLSLFRDRRFSVGILLFVMLGFAQAGNAYMLSVYLQSLQQVSPIQTSLTMLPNSLALFVFSILAGRWVGKFSNQKMIAGGLATMTLGLVLMAVFLNPNAGFMAFLLPLVLMGAGYSIANTPRVSIVLSSAPPELAGAASATNNASLKLGSAFGIAIMGALFQSTARSTFISDMVEAGVQTADIKRAADVLSAWLKANSGNVAGEFGITVQQLEGVVGTYQHAFTNGTAQALLVAAGVAIVGAILAWFTYKGKRTE